MSLRLVKREIPSENQINPPSSPSVKAESTEEATVYVNDLDVFVTLLEDSLAVLSLGLLCEERRYSYGWKKGESQTLITDSRRDKVQVWTAD